MAEEQQEQEATQETQETSEVKEGKEFTDFTDPKAEARFKRVYGHMKQNERVISEMGDDNKALLSRLEKMEFAQKDKAEAEHLKALSDQKKEALENQDHDKVVSIDEQIIDLKTQPKEVPKVEEKKPEIDPWFTPERQDHFARWSHETNGDGTFKRPYAHPDHPKHLRALEIGAAVASDPDFKDSELGDILEEVERLMAPRAKAVRTEAAVLDGDGAPRTTKTTSLTRDQKAIAAAMGISEEKYLNQVKAV